MFIALTQGKRALIDDSDFAAISKFKWHASKHCGIWYAARKDEFGQKIFMHRQILSAPADRMVDHVDGDGLNNQRTNIRLATNSQNQMNRKRQKSSSGFRGVTFHKQCGRWQAAIKCNGKSHYLGLYEVPEAAAEAYRQAASRLFGSFAA
jgi:hypothetical protein